jgi:hypothetical protein
MIESGMIPKKEKKTKKSELKKDEDKEETKN